MLFREFQFDADGTIERSFRRFDVIGLELSDLRRGKVPGDAAHAQAIGAVGR